MTFVPIWPLTNSSDATSGIVSGSTEQMRENWECLENILQVEHVGLTTSVASGKHKAGEFAALSYAPCAVIKSEPAGDGALGWASDTGTLYIYRNSLSSLSAVDNTGWRPLSSTASGTSLVRATLNSEHAIASATITVLNGWTDDEGSKFDIMGEFEKSTGVFTANSTGYYLVIGKVQWNMDDIAAGLPNSAPHWACLSATGGGYYGYNGAWGDGEVTSDLADIVYLTSGQSIVVCVYHADSVKALRIGAGSIHISRLY